MKLIELNVYKAPAIELLGKTRDDLAREYAELIMLDKPDKFFAEVNGIILTKYKPSGLLYIKEKAWKIVNEVEYRFESPAEYEHLIANHSDEIQ